MKTPRPTIHTILDSFFEKLSSTAPSADRVPLNQIETMLRTFLELDGERILVDQDRVIVKAERTLDPGCAFARTMHADDLIFALALFVEPRWLHPDRRLRGLQLSVTEQLTKQVMRIHLNDDLAYICPLLDIEARIDRAREQLAIRKGRGRVTRKW